MARLTRLALAGQLHHVALRGHGGTALFRDDTDRRAFLDCLQQAVRQHGLAVHAYALLESEAHWLATPPQDVSLGRAVQSLGRRYVALFNRRHGRSGTLWDGRFRSSLLESESWLFPAIVYVETLPVIRGLASQPDDWPWSSAAPHLGRRRDALLSDHPNYWSVGNTPFEREHAHADNLDKGLMDKQVAVLETALKRGLALGGTAFIKALQLQAARPLQARPRGRPSRH
jgi:putative transposase